MIEQIRNNKPHIAVSGDLMINEYIGGACERISPEAPVQVVSVKKKSTVLDSEGNALSNLQALDADVSLYLVIGSDNVKEVKLIGFVEGKNTSSIIKNISKDMC